MKRKIILGVAALAIFIVAGWLIHSYANSKNSFVYSGTVETREIQMAQRSAAASPRSSSRRARQSRPAPCWSQFEFDDVKAQRAQAQAQLEQAQASYQRLQRGNRPEDIAQAQANAQMQRAMLDSAVNGPRSQELKQAEADYAAAKPMQRTPKSTTSEWTHSYAATPSPASNSTTQKAMRDFDAQKAESLHQRLALLQAGTRRGRSSSRPGALPPGPGGIGQSCSAAIARKTSTQAAQRWMRPRHASTNSTCS